jgi:hypothetical protein
MKTIMAFFMGMIISSILLIVNPNIGFRDWQWCFGVFSIATLIYLVDYGFLKQ